VNLNFTAEEIAFRDEVRAFLAEKLPERLSGKVASGTHLSKAEMEEWHAILNERGWLANHWPVAYGGPGWSAIEKFIFETECALAHSPRVVPFGLNMLGPVLIEYGSEAQKRHWLPRILSGADWWCQGYSEPGAGSDLASVKTSAVRGSDAQGEHFIVNGQKTWTTLGQHANMIFCLVRTNREAKQQAGISFLLIDMSSPGVEVRPIITLDGDHEINVAGVGFSMAALEQLKALAAQQTKNGLPLADDALFAARLARVEIDLENMKTTNLRVIAAVAGGGAPGAESSMLKIRGTEIRQEISSLMRRATGSSARAFPADVLESHLDGQPVAAPYAASAAAKYFNNRKLSIFGGSNEIQKNIIAKQILGL
jgi:alkylation response protein AidB-like acyl-CoA dehydrogenase